jgi:hypothetical protein
LALIFESIGKLSSIREAQFTNFFAQCASVATVQIVLAGFDGEFIWVSNSFL